MSHVAEIQCQVKDLVALQKAAESLGGTLVESSTYKWYGRSVGDYPIPEGVKVEDLGKCDYKIAFPQDLTSYGYEVGVVRKGDGTYRFQWDFFDSKLKQYLGGEQAPKLVQRYACEVAKAQLGRSRYQVKETILADGTIELEQTIY